MEPGGSLSYLTRALPWRLDVVDEICFYGQNILHVHTFDADVDRNESSMVHAVANKMKITAFWDVMPSSLVHHYPHFRRVHCLHLQDRPRTWRQQVCPNVINTLPDCTLSCPEDGNLARYRHESIRGDEAAPVTMSGRMYPSTYTSIVKPLSVS
jgi:hypothetical protein